MEEHDITSDKSGKVLKKVLKSGDPSRGHPMKGDSVKVHYTGTLASDGSKFDSSVDRNEKFEFKVGVGQVIKGWDVGIMSMFEGEKSVFTIASDYGYGDMGSPPKIPPGASLVFEVELFDFKGSDVTEAKDEGVLKRVLREGKGQPPKEDAFIDISLKGRVNGKSSFFDERENVKYALGYGFENRVPLGVELALKAMSPKETAEVVISSPKYTGEVYKSFSVPDESECVYEVTLNSMEQSSEPWENSPSENLESAKSVKLKGNDYFKKGEFDVAAKVYGKALTYIKDSCSSEEGGNEPEWEEVTKSLRLNLVMCHLKLKEHFEARCLCDTIIEKHPDSVKAFFRRGEALLGLVEPLLAKKDFKTVLEMEPENKAAKNRLLEAGSMMSEQRKKEASLYANMFDKFAANDARREAEAQKRVKPVEIEDWK